MQHAARPPYNFHGARKREKGGSMKMRGSISIKCSRHDSLIFIRP